MYNVRTICLLLFYPIHTEIVENRSASQSAYLAMQVTIAFFSLAAINFGWILNIRASALYQTETITGALQSVATPRILSNIGSAAGSAAVLLILFCLIVVFLVMPPRIKINNIFTKLGNLSAYSNLDCLENAIGRVINRIHLSLEERLVALQYSFLVTAASGSNPNMFDDYRCTTVYLPIHVIVYERTRLF